MSMNEMKSKFKDAKLVDYTGKTSGFQQLKSFGQEFIDLVRNKQNGTKAVVVIDKGIAGRLAGPVIVRDHVNLTGDNPLVGPNDSSIGERFPIVQGIYYTDCPKGMDTAIIAGLKAGAIPDLDELSALREIGVDISTYNIVPSMLVAAHAGLKVLGIVLPEGAELSEKQVKEIIELKEGK